MGVVIGSGSRPAGSAGRGLLFIAGAPVRCGHTQTDHVFIQYIEEFVRSIESNTVEELEFNANALESGNRVVVEADLDDIRSTLPTNCKTDTSPFDLVCSHELSLDVEKTAPTAYLGAREKPTNYDASRIVH
jgi:hypothetical protein